MKSKKIDDLHLAVPGLKHVLDSNRSHVFNILWLLVISSSLILCFYQICNRFQLFLADPISTRVTIVRNDSVKFPSITICAPSNRHVPLKSLDLIVSARKNKSICELSPEDLLTDIDISSLWGNMSTEGLIQQTMMFSRLNFMDLKFGKSLDNVTVLTYSGTCATFSIKELVPFQGEDYAALMFFHPPPNEIACKHKFQTAMYLFHHDDDDITYQFATRFSVFSSFTNLIQGLSARHFKVINRTDSPCDSITAVNRCERKCIENYLQQQISCRLPFMLFNNIPLCANGSQTADVMQKTYRIIKNFNFAKNCICPKKCDEVLYSNNLKQSVSSKMQAFQYFFEEDFVVEISEYYSYHLIPFICDVGGNLGLFLGLCIPTIIELIQSVIFALYKKIN